MFVVLTYFLEQATEQNRLDFLNLARRSMVPQYSHLASSPLEDMPTMFVGAPACFFSVTSNYNYN